MTTFVPIYLATPCPLHVDCAEAKTCAILCINAHDLLGLFSLYNAPINTNNRYNGVLSLCSWLLLSGGRFRACPVAVPKSRYSIKGPVVSAPSDLCSKLSRINARLVHLAGRFASGIFLR